MNSSSKNPPFSSPPNTSDSLNGLKFGQKIYFEDVGIATPAKSGGGSPSKPPTAPGKKGRSTAAVQGPRCQVEGCGVDLSEAKAYYGRHKVCGVHSKTPSVVVNGLHQRFCQQCSRFHQLPEFDQGKRSCRRRLAGHNERRRKPPPGSLFPSPYRRLPSSVFETGKGGGFLMDFSTYPKVTERDTWPTIRAPNHSTPPGKSLPHLWHNDSANPSSGPFLQGSSSGIQYPVGPTIPSAECFTGTSNSGRALSLLSNNTWGPQSGSSGPFVSVEVAQMVQSTMATTHGVHANQFSSVPWGFKGHEDDVGSHVVPPHLGSNHFAQPADNQYSSELGSNQHRQYVQLEHSRAFDSSTQYMKWSL